MEVKMDAIIEILEKYRKIFLKLKKNKNHSSFDKFKKKLINELKSKNSKSYLSDEINKFISDIESADDFYTILGLIDSLKSFIYNQEHIYKM
jgi:hypothetical protein